MNARDVLRAIRKHWLIVAVFVVLGIAGGSFLILRAVPQYSSSVSFFVSTPTSDDASALAADQFATRRVNSYVRLAGSDKLANLVLNDTSLDMSTGSLSSEISASADLNTVLLRVSVVDRSKDRSLEIATSVATQFPVMIGEIDSSPSKSETVRLTVVSGPTLKPDAIRPSRVLNLGLGLLVGLLVGIVVAMLREMFDTTVHSREGLRDTADHPVLGVIGFDPAAPDEPLLVGRQARSLRAEAFRSLRTNLQFMNVDRPIQVIVVTSSIASEGKSTTSANLALVFAETGRRTLLIEADMRRPKVTEYLGLESGVGLSNVLAGQVGIDEVLQEWGEGGLTVLAGGAVPPNPSEMLGSKGMSELITRLRERFAVIIVDTPPLLPVTDAAVASVNADGVIMVVRYAKTTRTQVTSALSLLQAVDAPVLGTVLNMAQRRASPSYSYDGYGYYEATTEADAGATIFTRTGAATGKSLRWTARTLRAIGTVLRATPPAPSPTRTATGPVKRAPKPASTTTNASSAKVPNASGRVEAPSRPVDGSGDAEQPVAGAPNRGADGHSGDVGAAARGPSPAQKRAAQRAAFRSQRSKLPRDTKRKH